jgi:hypothetical protein
LIEDASLKFIIPFAVATTLAFPAAAQDFGTALLPWRASSWDQCGIHLGGYAAFLYGGGF